jgi:hypothetical protein
LNQLVNKAQFLHNLIDMEHNEKTQALATLEIKEKELKETKDFYN